MNMIPRTDTGAKAQDDLQRRLAQMTIQDEQDLLAFLPLASRLAAIEEGTREPLDRWHSLAQPFQSHLDRILRERAEEGVWDLGYARGEDLGLAVISAQDFACFLALERERIPTGAQDSLAAWAEEAEETLLDEEAVETLELFRRRYPIQDRYLLNIVRTPISAFERAVVALAATPRPKRTQIVQWAEGGSRVLVERITEDGKPSEELKASFRMRDRKIEAEGGTMVLSADLTDDWVVRVQMHWADSGEMTGVESVRLGRHPGHREHPKSDARWFIRLGPFQPDYRLKVLREDSLIVNRRSGHRVEVTPLPVEVPDRRSVEQPGPEPLAVQPTVLPGVFELAAAGEEGYGKLSHLSGGQLEAATKRRPRCIEFEAEDRSWTGFLRIPSTPSAECRLTLRLNDSQGRPIDAAEVVLCGITLQVTRGHAVVQFGELQKAWEARGREEFPLRLRWAGGETMGRVKESRGGGPANGHNGHGG